MKSYVVDWLLPSLHVTHDRTHVSLTTYNRWAVPILPLTYNLPTLLASVENVRITRERQLNLGRYDMNIWIILLVFAINDLTVFRRCLSLFYV